MGKREGEGGKRLPVQHSYLSRWESLVFIGAQKPRGEGIGLGLNAEKE